MTPRTRGARLWHNWSPTPLIYRFLERGRFFEEAKMGKGGTQPCVFQCIGAAAQRTRLVEDPADFTELVSFSRSALFEGPHFFNGLSF
jgi:hypothetical protein